MSTAEKVSLDATHTVLTPEYVEFNFVLAGLMSRFLALLLDTFVSIVIAYVGMVVVLLLTAGFSLASGGEGGGFGAAGQFIIWFLVDWGYMVLLESLWSGQTVGKRLFGLRVVELTGKPLTLMTSFGRYGGYAAGMATGGLGFAQVLWDANRQAVQDKLAHTVVVDLRRAGTGAATA